MTTGRKRVGAVTCVILVILSGVAVGSVAGLDHATTASQVDVDASDLQGSGTEDDPYRVTDASELQAMEDDLDAHYELTADIDASGTAERNDGSGFDPVGSTSSDTRTPFKGTLDGNGHTITGLTIDRPGRDDVGLIGVNEGSIRDVSLMGLSVTGGSSVGGLVGTNLGTVEGVAVSGKIRGSDTVGGLVGINGVPGAVRNATASGNVTGERSVGGLAGAINGNVTAVAASGNVSGENDVGGLVGASFGGTVATARASGNVTGESGVGGLVGLNSAGSSSNGIVRNAAGSGNVSGVRGVGGLVGVSDGGAVQDAFVTGCVTSVRGGGVVGAYLGDGERNSTTDAYWDTQATGQSTSAGSATGLSTAQMTGDAARANMDGLDFESTWATSESYPQLRLLGRALPEAAEPGGDDAQGTPRGTTGGEDSAADMSGDSSEGILESRTIGAIAGGLVVVGVLVALRLRRQ
jgi:hypothetical protein